MFKNKINYKLLNFGILVIIVYFMYQTGTLWFGLFNKAIDIFSPFLIAFFIAYALYPIVVFLKNKNVPKILAVSSTFLILIGILAAFLGFAIPAIYNQLGSLVNNLLSFVTFLSNKYSIDLSLMQTSLNDVIKNISLHAGTGAINFLLISLNLLARLAVILAVTAYFLYDMDRIRNYVKKILIKGDEKTFSYVKTLDKNMKAYVIGFSKISLIAFFEYSILYFIVGHPHALLLAFLMALANLIPYFGGIIINIVAAATAFSVSPLLFAKTCVAFVIGSTIDGYVTGPLVYGKSNSIHPLVTIFAIFAGGLIFGVYGIIISIPVTIFIMVTYEFYGEELIDKISSLANNK